MTPLLASNGVTVVVPARLCPVLMGLAFALAACGGGGGTDGGGGTMPGTDGTVATIQLSGPTSFTAGSPQTASLTISAKNSSGRLITGTYANAITLQDSDTTGATSLTLQTVTSAAQTVQIAYDGSGGFKGATITATAQDAHQRQITIAAGPTCSPIQSGGKTIEGYYPCHLRDAYSLPSTGGAGQTVAIVDAYDDPNAASDLATYRSTFGLPACTVANGCFTKVSQTGSTTSLPGVDSTGGWETEESLDLDMVSAVCPNCTIVLVEANSNSGSNLYAAEDEAAALEATEISNSWGGSEYSGETSEDAHFDRPGVVVTASSGDDAYQAGTQYPAASPYVTAVGGTSLSTANNDRGWTETVWEHSSTDGTGSGCSSYEPQPAWQQSVGAITSVCAKRAYNDVSAVADPDTGVAVYDTYDAAGWEVVGGTSAASPIIAATFALAGNGATIGLGYAYAHTGAFNDVSSGENGTCANVLCEAAIGWDGPTGWGTPSGVNGLTAFALHLRTGPEAAMVSTALPHRRLCSAPAPGYMRCFAIEVVGSH